jgi:hypothetical protein
MNKKLIVAMLFPAFSLFAAESLDPAALAKVAKEREEWTKQHFAKQGSPVPDGGVTVMPEQQMSEYNTFKEQRIKERADVKKYGYVKLFLPQIQSLLNFKEVSKNRFAAQSANPADEGMRHSITEIEMAYDFKGVPSHSVTTMLGVAPSVTYITGQGWAGAMQFFEKTGLGNCSYRENNLKFSHGAAIIPEEDATKDVNGKITVTNITGEPKAGFLYSVDWYDNNYFRELKCANEKFEPSIMSSAIELARGIDNNG